MARAIDSEVAFRFLTEQLVKETGAFSKGVNKGLNIARSAMRNPDAIPTITPPNEPLTLEQLREMDGEPVWVTPLGFWALVIAKPGERVRLISNDGETVWADKEIELVGPVYRRPPEGEEEA